MVHRRPCSDGAPLARSKSRNVIEQLDLATMQRASPLPAEFTVSDPYVLTFYFVPSDRRQELARLERLS